MESPQPGFKAMNAGPSGARWSNLKLALIFLALVNVVAGLFVFLTLGFAWFYMRDQFMWAIIAMLLVIVPLGGLDLSLVFLAILLWRQPLEHKINQ